MVKGIVTSLLFVGASLTPQAAQGQFIIGAHAAWSGYAEGSPGAGARLGWDLPVLPIDFVGVAEFFSPNCPANTTGCSFWGATLDANLRLPIPMIRPYLTGGLSYRSGKLREDAESESSSGVNIGVGLDVRIVVRIFADYRYEFLTNDLEGPVARAGLIFNL
jgi:opacity protein-like surface antigen